jgi:hypothetical protein
MRKISLLCGLLALIIEAQMAGAGELLKPPAIWKDYDPNKGDFKEQIVTEGIKDGIYSRDCYISAYPLGREIRVFCKYAVKAGAKKVPGLLNVHGWMATANIKYDYVKDGWAVMSFDYCGNVRNRKDYTKYPECFRYGNMDKDAGPAVHDTRPDGTPIDVPCIQRYCGTPGKTTLLAFVAIIMPVIAHSIGD